MKLRTNIMPQACFGSPQGRFSSNGGSYSTLKKNYVFLIRLHNETRKRLKQHRYISIFFLASGC